MSNNKVSGWVNGWRVGQWQHQLAQIGTHLAGLQIFGSAERLKSNAVTSARVADGPKSQIAVRSARVAVILGRTSEVKLK